MTVRSLLSNRYLVLASRCVLGMTFIAASIGKIAVPEAFASSIEAYRLIPYSSVNLFAIVVAWLELVCGLFLVSGLFTRAASVLLSSLLAVFIFAISAALLRGLTIDCGCFGAAYSSPVSWARVVEDIALFMLGVHLCFFPESVFALENLFGPPSNG